MPIPQPRCVLIPVDIGNLNVEILDLARTHITDNDRPHIVAVYASSEQTNSALVWGTIDGESREAYAHRDVRHRLANTAWADAEVHIAFGDPAEQIAGVARQIGADLILLPVSKLGFIARLMGGGVAEGLLRNVPCPMLVIPVE